MHYPICRHRTIARLMRYFLTLSSSFPRKPLVMLRVRIHLLRNKSKSIPPKNLGLRQTLRAQNALSNGHTFNFVSKIDISEVNFHRMCHTSSELANTRDRRLFVASSTTVMGLYVPSNILNSLGWESPLQHSGLLTYCINLNLNEWHNIPLYRDICLMN